MLTGGGLAILAEPARAAAGAAHSLATRADRDVAGSLLQRQRDRNRNVRELALAARI